MHTIFIPYKRMQCMLNCSAMTLLFLSQHTAPKGRSSRSTSWLLRSISGSIPAAELAEWSQLCATTEEAASSVSAVNVSTVPLHTLEDYCMGTKSRLLCSVQAGATAAGASSVTDVDMSASVSNAEGTVCVQAVAVECSFVTKIGEFSHMSCKPKNKLASSKVARTPVVPSWAMTDISGNDSVRWPVQQQLPKVLI